MRPPPFAIIGQSLQLIRVTLFFLALHAATAFSNEVRPLWEETKWDGNIPTTPGALGYAIAKINPQDLLSSANATFSLKLPGGRSATIRKDRQTYVGKNAFVWQGKIQKEPLSTVTFSVAGDSIVGDIVSGNGHIYRLRSLAPGVALVEILDSRKLPAGHEPIYPPLVPSHSKLPPNGDSGAVSRSATCATPPNRTRSPTNQSETIKVLAFYTSAAKEAELGTTNVKLRVIQAVEEANTSYINSGVSQRIELVGTSDPLDEIRELPTYKERPTIESDLNLLRQDGDGYADEVHGLRDCLHADIVVLIVERPNNGGVAYQLHALNMYDPSLEQYAFAVVPRHVATGKFGFAHELGHLMGAQHDATAAAGAIGAFNYSYGYINPDPASVACLGHQWMTMMSQNNACSTCTNIQLWSKPGSTPFTEGTVTCTLTAGSATANNAQTLDATAEIVRSFR
jgi:peptidyl-Asp metalloendopeptidase